jgi:hypothetical protein
MKNVLCYSVGHKKYIEFEYYMKDGKTIHYNYERLAYIIDYGRSFFYESDTHNSNVILDKLCRLPCPTPCGEEDGFTYLFGKPSVHITANKRNMSADLRLMSIALKLPNIQFKGLYGTPEVEQSGFSRGVINNVSDALLATTEYVNNHSADIMRQYTLKGYTKMGVLHIYEDGVTPMRYEPISGIPRAPIPAAPISTAPISPTSPPHIHSYLESLSLSPLTSVAPLISVAPPTSVAPLTSVAPPTSVAPLTPDSLRF